MISIQMLTARQKYFLYVFAFICILCVFYIFVLYTPPSAEYVEPTQPVKRAKPIKPAQPVYRLLELNTNYSTVAELYPNIEPISPNVVPDIVHYMQFLHSDVSFLFYLSVKSVVKYHKPALIMVHCDCNNMTGKYWDLLLSEKINIVIHRVNLVTEIGGRKIHDGWLGPHNKDFQINSVLIEYGGFFIDEDTFVFHSYQEFRRYNFSLKVDSPTRFGCNFMMTARNLLFHKMLRKEWIDDYHVDDWSWNCGGASTQIAVKHPSMYPFNFRSKPEFVDNFTCNSIMNALFNSTANVDEIIKFYSVHLCNVFLKEHHAKELHMVNDIDYIWDCDKTFCKVARYILE